MSRVRAYPGHVREAAIVMAEDGMPALEIAALVGVSRNCVYRWLEMARLDGRHVPARQDRHGVIVLRGSPATRHQLQAEAARRNMTEVQLIDSILATVATDNLFNAVLEDAE